MRARLRSRRVCHAIAALAAAGLTVFALAAPAAAAPKTGYQVTNLTSNQAGVANHQDPNLQNAWGLAAGPNSPWWVADNQSDVSTLYTEDGTGAPANLPLVVNVPGGPTGVVFNSTLSNTSPSFNVSAGGQPPRRSSSSTERTALFAAGTPASLRHRHRPRPRWGSAPRTGRSTRA